MKPRRRSAAKPSHTEIDLAQQIGELRGIVVKGFEVVEEHFRVLNGRVGKHDDLFGKILGDEREQKGFQRGAWLGIVTSWKFLFAVATITLGVLAIIFGPH